jgi:uncharacterized protein with ParB-like and HNH nuclease domain
MITEELIKKDESLLEKEIKEARNSLSTDRLDMSFGEIIGMYEREEIIINPEFQRLFRWDNYQQTRFIESLLLGIPIPPIFVAEKPDSGKWELVDGLQRVSSVLSFLGKLKTSREKNFWELEEGDIIKEIEGYKYIDLPLKYQLAIKRAVCRVEILRWNSSVDMRYELFSRLNTGGTPLTEQEIRNSIFRPDSNEFNQLLKKLSQIEKFIELIKPSEQQIEELYLEELVLRFISLLNAAQSGIEIKDNVSKYMTNYMRDIIKSNSFQYDYFENHFKRVIELLYVVGKKVFRGSQGPFSPNLYDVIMLGISMNIDQYEKLGVDDLQRKIEQAKNDESYRKIAGISANSKIRVSKRIEFAKKFFSLVP